MSSIPPIMQMKGGETPSKSSLGGSIKKQVTLPKIGQNKQIFKLPKIVEKKDFFKLLPNEHVEKEQYDSVIKEMYGN